MSNKTKQEIINYSNIEKIEELQKVTTEIASKHIALYSMFIEFLTDNFPEYLKEKQRQAEEALNEQFETSQQ